MNRLAGNKESVIKTKKADLCVSCGICSAVCPQGAVKLVYKLGQFLPEVDARGCIKCGLCLDLCPGYDIYPLDLRDKDFISFIKDNALMSYTAYAKNFKNRMNSASGGVITSLIVDLIKTAKFDCAFILDFNMFCEQEVKLEATNDLSKIRMSAKSKYIPASVENVIKILKEKNQKKYIIVGVPCQIFGIKKFIRKFRLKEDNLLFLGLFCSHTNNFNIIKYFEQTYKHDGEKLVKFDFRNKEKNGWPGDTKMIFNSSRELVVDREVRMELKKIFQLNRCLFCVDKLNRLADISVGDCYINRQRSSFGKSSVIAMSEKGANIFKNHSSIFVCEEEPLEIIMLSQAIQEKEENFENVLFYTKKYNYSFYSSASDINDEKVCKRLNSQQRIMCLGKKYMKLNIDLRVFLQNFKRKTIHGIKIFFSAVCKVIFVLVFFAYSFIRQTRKKDISHQNKGNNIIIVGGGMFNQGAQAMTFTVVNQCLKHFPDKNIFLFSMRDYYRAAEEKNNYNFKILPWDFDVKACFLKLIPMFVYDVIKKQYVNPCINNARKVIQDGYCFIDISGYALSSQFGIFTALDYFFNISVAKEYSIPYYILPQSIGPFKYKGIFGILMRMFLKKYLAYPKKIYVREQEGLDCVLDYSRSNVEKSYDIVLLNAGYNPENIYKRYHVRKIDIEPCSVGIIPNQKVVERSKDVDIFGIYQKIITRVLDHGCVVYLLKYSFEDAYICEKIKSFFAENNQVKIIGDDLNSVESEYIIKQFSCVIASRYHSIVHAYSNGVPAFVMGWATKYHELMKEFGQTEYCFDFRDNINIYELLNKFDDFLSKGDYHKQTILDKLFSIKKENNIFDLSFLR
ncbi:MAG: Coenzyme F420 hydrogenase/dehydrogenase, beta subunit C-terminal domain [Candidatus Omnitrophica bacterium]|nr:Coenzyme F420 hydrogenase/dehydrogenase, beta subunit C-terminal domain [Candidatus Omnitrophota bacterium]